MLDEVLLDTDGSESWSPSSVGDTESLVQVEVTYVSPYRPWRGQHQLCIHVGSIHVDLASLVVDDLTDPVDMLFLDSTRGGLGHHEAREVSGVGLLLEVLHVD